MGTATPAQSGLRRLVVFGMIGGATLSLLIGGSLVYLQWLWVSPGGADRGTFAAESFLILVSAMLVLASIVAAGFAMNRRTRRSSIMLVAGGVVFVALLAASSYVRGVVWDSALDRLAKRSASVTDAIHRFERANGRLPASLNDLVPEFFLAVPTTGAGSWPHYSYVARDGTWQLSVNMGGGIPLLRRQFQYDPAHIVTEGSYVGRRFGDWVEISD